MERVGLLEGQKTAVWLSSSGSHMWGQRESAWGRGLLEKLGTDRQFGVILARSSYAGSRSCKETKFDSELRVGVEEELGEGL